MKVFTKENITLYHGDCEEILPALDVKAQAIITDPPYGIAFRSNMRSATPKFDSIVNDDVIQTDWIELLNNVIDANACIFAFTRWDVEHIWREAISQSGWNVKSQVIWYKPGGGLGDLYAQFSPSHENAIFAIKGDWKFSGRRPPSVYNFNKDASTSYEHPTQKPVTLMSRIVLDITAPGDLVIDPFFGSCSTGVACARYDRKFIGIEINEEYFELGCENISKELEKPMLF
jgi:site-specific DNA-methyltransferase (adenine-specific)